MGLVNVGKMQRSCFLITTERIIAPRSILSLLIPISLKTRKEGKEGGRGDEKGKIKK